MTNSQWLLLTDGAINLASVARVKFVDGRGGATPKALLTVPGRDRPVVVTCADDIDALDMMIDLLTAGRAAGDAAADEAADALDPAEAA